MKLIKTETPQPNVWQFTFAADAAKLETACQAVYDRCRATLEVPGYAPGQADRAAAEAAHGESLFWYEAINDVLAAEMPSLLDKALADNGLEPVDDVTYGLQCVTKAEGFTVTAQVITLPDITIPRCTGFVTRCTPNPVADQDVAHFIQRRRAAMATLLPHTGAAAPGCIATLSYVGWMDGAPIPDGEAQGQQIQLGAGRMIPGFEQAVLGHLPGEDFEIRVTFPENYGVAELAGKPAVFKAHLDALHVRVLPDMDDAFAQKAGKVENMDAFRTAVRAQLQQLRLTNAKARARTDILRLLGEELTGSLPHALTETACQAQMAQLQEALAQQHRTLDQYIAQNHLTPAGLQAQLRAQAEKQVRVRMALYRIAREQHLEPTEAEVDVELAACAAKNRQTLAQFMETTDRRAMRRSICAERAAEYVIANSTILYE